MCKEIKVETENTELELDSSKKKKTRCVWKVLKIDILRVK